MVKRKTLVDADDQAARLCRSCRCSCCLVPSGGVHWIVDAVQDLQVCRGSPRRIGLCLLSVPRHRLGVALTGKTAFGDRRARTLRSTFSARRDRIAIVCIALNIAPASHGVNAYGSTVFVCCTIKQTKRAAVASDPFVKTCQAGTRVALQTPLPRLPCLPFAFGKGLLWAGLPWKWEPPCPGCQSPFLAQLREAPGLACVRQE